MLSTSVAYCLLGLFLYDLLICASVFLITENTQKSLFNFDWSPVIVSYNVFWKLCSIPTYIIWFCVYIKKNLVKRVNGMHTFRLMTSICIALKMYYIKWCLIKSITNKFVNQSHALSLKIANLNPFETTHKPSAVSRWRGSYINSIITSGRNGKKTPVNCTLIKDRRICTRRWGLVLPYARVWLFCGGIFEVQKAKRTAIHCMSYRWCNESPFKYISAKRLVLVLFLN